MNHDDFDPLVGASIKDHDMVRYALETYDRLSSRRRRSATNPSWLVGNNVAGRSFPGIGPLILRLVPAFRTPAKPTRHDRHATSFDLGRKWIKLRWADDQGEGGE